MKRLIIVLLILFAGCAGGPPPPGRSKPAPLPLPPPSAPLSKGKTLGRQFMQTALKEYTFVTDYEVVGQVNRVGKEILEAIGEDPGNFHFFVVRQNQLNAFAIPGGYIFIFDGLLRQLQSVDALAGVLAHEIAHVEKNHFFKDAKKMSAINLATMASIILAGLTGENLGATGAIGTAANISFQLKFSRKNEEEADLHAIKYLKQTRYDPSGLAEFFKTLSFYSGFTSGVAPTYFSTHPGLSERRRMVETLTKDLPAVQDSSVSPTENWRKDWGRIVTILQAQGAEGTAMPSPQANSKNIQQSKARQFYLSGLSAFRSGHLQSAIHDYQESIRLDGSQAVYYADLSYIQMQRQEASLSKASALKSIQLSENNPIPYLVLGMIAQSEDDHENAVKFLETARDRAPDHPFIHLQLARSYHSLSKRAAEQFHLGRYLRLNYEPSKAIVQFQKALTSVDERSAIALKIRREIKEITRDGV